MTYASLVAAKGTSGSIANWVAYTLLDLPPILDEAQSLLYQYLRVREMRTTFSFTMLAGMASIDLPARFLDPIGRALSSSTMSYFRHTDENYVLSSRNYSESSGSFGASPFTTTVNSTQVSVSLASHGFNDNSPIYIASASAVGGLTLNGTFEIVSVTNTNTFVIDTKAATAATSSATGGGSSATYICDSIVQGFPAVWSIWDEKIKFDSAFSQTNLVQLQYYQSLPLLSSTNTNNFLTNRYPQLLRTACMAAAADFMQDESEYQRLTTRLGAIVQGVMVENDGVYRGAEIDTEIP